MAIEKTLQRAKLTEQYGAETEKIILLFLSQQADPLIGTPCQCEKGVRLIRCRDCCQRPPLCVKCFVREHKYTPFHWAEHWDKDLGYFRACDLSTLDPDWALNLGHSAEPCPKALKTSNINIIDTNGPHGTRVRYCKCDSCPSKWQQLFDARLFPGTVTDPGTAYTFRLMREYEVHSVASKKNARDYTKALAQLADRQFPEQVPVSFNLTQQLFQSNRGTDFLHPISLYSSSMVVSQDQSLGRSGTWNRQILSPETKRKLVGLLPCVSRRGLQS